MFAFTGKGTVGYGWSVWAAVCAAYGPEAVNGMGEVRELDWRPAPSSGRGVKRVAQLVGKDGTVHGRVEELRD